MQMMYVMAFLVTLIVLSLSVGRDAAAVVEEDSKAVAGHMATWHGTAQKHCAANACAGGILDVRPRLQPMLRNAPAFAQTRFVTRVDNVNRMVVTYMDSAFAARGSVAYGGVAAALVDLAGINPESSAFGVWRASSRRVEFSAPPSRGSTYLSLPSPFMGGTIPDGSPVIVGRL